jgi:hypothetical protein
MLEAKQAARHNERALFRIPDPRGTSRKAKGKVLLVP